MWDLEIWSFVHTCPGVCVTNLDNAVTAKVRKKAKIRNQYNQAQPWSDPGSDKNTIEHHIQQNQDVSPFPAGYHKAVMNSLGKKTNTKHTYITLLFFFQISIIIFLSYFPQDVCRLKVSVHMLIGLIYYESKARLCCCLLNINFFTVFLNNFQT